MTKERLLVFLLGCFGARLLLAELARRHAQSNLRDWALMGALPAAGFLVLFIVPRPDEANALETFGRPIWWRSLRPVHAMLYLMFVLLAYNAPRYAHVPLFLDAILGITAFTVFHLLQG